MLRRVTCNNAYHDEIGLDVMTHMLMSSVFVRCDVRRNSIACHHI